MITYIIATDESIHLAHGETPTLTNAIDELVRLQSAHKHRLQLFARDRTMQRYYTSERGAVGVIRVYSPFDETLTSYRLDRSKTAVVAERVELV